MILKVMTLLLLLFTVTNIKLQTCEIENIKKILMNQEIDDIGFMFSSPPKITVGLRFSDGFDSTKNRRL